jgi:hypothetical protein
MDKVSREADFQERIKEKLIRNTVKEVKNAHYGLDLAGKRISEFECMSTEVSKIEK